MWVAHGYPFELQRDTTAHSDPTNNYYWSERWYRKGEGRGRRPSLGTVDTHGAQVLPLVDIPWFIQKQVR